MNNWCWFSEIYKPDSFIVSTRKLKQAIEKYGVDSRDYTGSRLLINAINHMTPKQIDVLLSYKPSFTFQIYHPEPRVFWHGYYDSRTVMILDKFLTHDVDYIYNTCPIYYDMKRYHNLLELVNWLLDDDKLLITDYHQRILHEQRYLLENHMRKGISLFELMLPWLEKNNKKRRFQ